MNETKNNSKNEKGLALLERASGSPSEGSVTTTERAVVARMHGTAVAWPPKGRDLNRRRLEEARLEESIRIATNPAARFCLRIDTRVYLASCAARALPKAGHLGR